MEPNDPHHQHRARAPRTVLCSALTISDTRTPETDRSGPVLRETLEAAGHQVVSQAIVPDDPEAIRAAILGALAEGAQAVVCSGGTGLTRRDSTFEVVSALIERPLPGFGELFRMLSYEEIGAAAMLSRAVAGVVGGGVVFALPGSSKGARLGMEKLVAPELGHVLDQLSR
jgi:molybdenum cofactor biosynthesis protein B